MAGSEGGVVIPTEGLVAHWTMDSITGSTLEDETTSYDATISGAVQTTGSGGHIGEALEFDGTDDYFYCADSGLNLSVFTVSMWFKSDDASYSNERQLWTTTDSSNTSGTLTAHIDDSGNDLQFGVHGGSILEGDTIFTDTDWHHVAFSRDSDGSAKIWLDGNLEKSGTLSPPSAYEQFQVGKGHTAYGAWDGRIDHMRIYNRALSESEIGILAAEA